MNTNWFKYIIAQLLIVVSLTMHAQNSKRIEILNANSIEFDENIGKDVKRLIGDVQFKHGNALMFCDSAYLNSRTNILQAFSNVHINQNDSIDLYGDFLNYNGNTKLAKVRQNVRLLHNNSILKTDSLDFDRTTNIAHYFSWGYLNDQDNDLKSLNGYYYSDTKDYYAVDSVTLTNPDYVIYSDSLRYNTGSDISYFYGPTEIISDSNYIYCEFGWYDTYKNLARVSKNSFIQNKEKKLIGDSIFYDRNISFGEAFSNVSILDTSAQILITGNYANYYENPDRAYVTDSALMTKYGGGDTLFLHADTLKLYTILDSLRVQDIRFVDSTFSDTLQYSVPEEDIVIFDTNSVAVDSIPKISTDTLQVIDVINSTEKIDISNQVKVDTIYTVIIDTIKIVTAYKHAQIFKKDLQTRCDSLSYSSKDSIIRLYGDPTIWSDNQQITAEYIEILTENNNPTELFLDQSAFIVLKDDSIRYNQIEGITMRGYFNDNNELYKLWVESNAKSIFFPREDPTEEQKRDSLKGNLVGTNVTESKNMMIWFEENQPYKITLYQAPKGLMDPVDEKPIEEYFLSGFKWKSLLRPQSVNDIFIWKEASIEETESEIKKTTQISTK